VQLEKRIEADIIVARTLIAQKKKERALLALKKKKLSENQLQNIQAYLMNVEGMVSAHRQPVPADRFQHIPPQCNSVQ
jgi:charged multivesicular body protein 6